MANTRVTSSFITREFMSVLHSNLHVVRSIDHSWNKLFGKSIGPVGRSGPTVNIRKPVLGSIRSGWTMDQGDVTESSVALTIDTPVGVDMNFSDADLALSIEDFSERYIQPNAMKLASYIDMSVAAYLKNYIFNQVAVSSLGTAPNAISYFLSAGRLIKENLVPMDSPLNCIISPRTEAAMVGALAGQYNPQGNISEMYLKGQMSRAAGFDWYMSQTLPSHTHGTCTTGTSPAVSGYTTNTMTISGVTSSGTLTAGDIFTVSTSYAINQETKQAYSSLQQFVVTSTTTASGTNITVAVSPNIVLTGPGQTISGAPSAATNAVTFAQTTASQSVQNDLVLHEKSFAIAFADLEMPNNMDMSSVVSSDGISIRFLRGFDIANARFLSRMDCFYGLVATRPEWAAKIIS
jgi:hypothetical protein